jgi:phage tail-like protein
LQYLPEIYHTRFMGRFLALFESIWTPLEWQVENFDLYLSPRTAPADFLPWLASWFDVVFDESWEEEQRRQLLLEAHKIFAERGTKNSMERLLQIYTECEVEIDDTSEDLAPFTFIVRVPKQEKELNRVLVERLIDTHKPAHTSYELLFG